MEARLKSKEDADPKYRPSGMKGIEKINALGHFHDKQYPQRIAKF